MLLPVGVVLGLVTVAALFFALSNIAMLFSVFLTGATVIYIFSSFVFLQKGIDKKIVSKHFLKDLIKVNAYVALFFSILGLMQGVLVLVNPETIKLFTDSMSALQPGNPQLADKPALYQMVKGVLYFMVVLCGLLLFHITATFRYIRQYKDLFVSA